MEQLNLPYEEITALANRDYMRDSFTRSSREIYKIPFDSLIERSGFNKRLVYEGIEALADSIAAKGLDQPLDVDVLPDGRVVIEKGHRRYRAIKFNKERGIDMEFVDCYPNHKTKTELQRMEDVYNSNMHSSKLNSVEQANTVFALKTYFGKISNEDIGKKIGVSRQQVDNLLLIAESGDDTKQDILNGNLGITEALKYIRGLKKINKQSDDAELKASKTSAAPPSDPEDLLANDIKELAELEKETDEERDQRLLREKTKADQILEQLMEVSDEIKVRSKSLSTHIGRKLSLPIQSSTNEILIPKGIVLTEEEVALILENKIDTIFVYKKGMEPVAQSVITVAPEKEGKERYDMSRPEIEKIQKAIQAGDKIESIVSKLDVPEQTKNDIAYQVHWLNENLQFVREWVHLNKKQNKSR